MKASNPPLPQVTLRVPGPWRDLEQLARRLPESWSVEDRFLLPPAGPRLGIDLMPADGQFPDIFRQSLRRDARRCELRGVDRYRNNAVVVGYGGSLDCARLMLVAGAAVATAGGHGVFNDNGTLAHGAADWIGLVEHIDNPLAVFYAYIRLIRDRRRGQFASAGMHVFGHREAVIDRGGDDDASLRSVEDFARATVCQQRQWSEGQQFEDEEGRRFVVRSESERKEIFAFGPDHACYNPWGSWRLKPLKAGGL